MFIVYKGYPLLHYHRISHGMKTTRANLYLSCTDCSVVNAFSYCGDEDLTGKYCAIIDGSVMENLSEQCIITEYVCSYRGVQTELQWCQRFSQVWHQAQAWCQRIVAEGSEISYT